jgi:hypothetical protein
MVYQDIDGGIVESRQLFQDKVVVEDMRALE